MGNSPGLLPAMRRTLRRMLVILAILVLAQVGGSPTEASVDLTTTTEGVHRPISQSAPSTALRDSATGESMVKVQSLDDVKKVLASSLPKRLEAGVRRTTAAEVEKYGLPLNHGVVIGWLDPKGPLGRAGLNIGDIIVQVDNQPIAGLEDFVGLVDSLGVGQTATFCVVDKRSGSLRNVMIVVGESERFQEPRGNFFSRNVGAAVAGIKKAAQSVKEHVGYVAEMGRGAYTTVIHGLKKWVGEAEEPLVSVKQGEETSLNPKVPARNVAAGPR